MLMTCLMVLYFLFVHVAVGFGEDCVDVGGRQSCYGETEGDADAGGAEAVVEPVVYGAGLLLILHGLDHEEFVATHAEDGVRRAAVHKDACCRLDQLVADDMPPGIVHRLEPVDIEHHEGDVGLLRDGLAVAVKGGAIEDACKVIEEGEPP